RRKAEGADGQSAARPAGAGGTRSATVKPSAGPLPAPPRSGGVMPIRFSVVAASAALALAACTDDPTPGTAAAADEPPEAASETAATVEDAERFVERAETELADDAEFAARTFWVQSNFITFDTNWLAARA